MAGEGAERNALGLLRCHDLRGHFVRVIRLLEHLAPRDEQLRGGKEADALQMRGHKGREQAKKREGVENAPNGAETA